MQLLDGLCLKHTPNPIFYWQFLSIIIMFPAMITGSTPVAVLTTGVLVAPILLRMKIPKLETAAIILWLL
jgi:hypothetical protein